MNDEAPDLLERTKAFALRVIKMCLALPLDTRAAGDDYISIIPPSSFGERTQSRYRKVRLLLFSPSA